MQTKDALIQYTTFFQILGRKVTDIDKQVGTNKQTERQRQPYRHIQTHKTDKQTHTYRQLKKANRQQGHRNDNPGGGHNACY